MKLSETILVDDMRDRDAPPYGGCWTRWRCRGFVRGFYMRPRNHDPLPFSWELKL
jgi:hypothetical protein